MKLSVGFLIFISVNLYQTKAYNVLIMLPFASISQKHIFDRVVDILVENVHKVSLVSPYEDHKGIQGFQNIALKKNKQILNSGNFTFFQGSVNNLMVMKAVMDLVFDVRDATFQNPEFKKIWQNSRTSNPFDVLVTDAVFNEFCLPLAYHWNIPTIYISSSILFTPIAWNLNIPFPLSYLPTGLNGAKIPMDLLTRLTNVFGHLNFMLLRNWYLFPYHDKFFKSIYNHTPPLIQLESGVSFVMTHTHPALFPSAPSMPYSAEIACIHCRSSQKLSKDLQDYFDLSGEPGVIYFSLGSYTRGDSMPLEMKEKILAAFARLPQRILWKFEEEIENLPLNIKLTKWAPQQDVLGHPKLKLFITHGGGLSTLEAAYHGCPILGFPLSADQLSNIVYAADKGFAESLDWKTFTTASLIDKINIILSDTRYKDNALRLSRLLKDQPQSPATKAVYWIEYIIRHKGAPHLKSSANNLNFFSYFMLDVIAFLSLILVVVLKLLYVLLKISKKVIISLFTN